MRLPLILIALDSGDVVLCDSLEKAESEIEVPDVDVWAVYDSEGKKFDKSVTNRRKKFFLVEFVEQKVSLTETKNYEPETLIAHLLKYQQRIKTDRVDQDLVSLQGLVTRMKALNGYRE